MQSVVRDNDLTGRTGIVDHGAWVVNKVMLSFLHKDRDDGKMERRGSAHLETWRGEDLISDEASGWRELQRGRVRDREKERVEGARVLAPIMTATGSAQPYWQGLVCFYSEYVHSEDLGGHSMVVDALYSNTNTTDQ